MSVDKEEKISVERLTNLVLDIGTYLLASGAHCGRISRNISRMTDVWGFEVHLDLTFNGLLATVKEKSDEKNLVTAYMESPTHSVHLEVLTEVSHLSWRVYDEGLSVEEVEGAFAKIKTKPNYSSLTVAVAVAFSCAGLCFFSFGDFKNALVAFCAAFVGYMVKTAISSRSFNSMIAISIAAFTTTLITGIAAINGIGANPEAAIATAVLYLIPGVPLINCVIDLIEGYLSSAINRALFGGFTLLCIAAGMTLCITLIGIKNIVN